MLKSLSHLVVVSVVIIGTIKGINYEGTSKLIMVNIKEIHRITQLYWKTYSVNKKNS